MSIFKNGKFYHYEFFQGNRRYRGSTGKADKEEALDE